MDAHRSVRTAVVGAGVFGGRHADKLAANPNAQLVAVVDVDADRAAAVASRAGAAALSAVEALPPDVEAVTVATPTSTHHAVGMALLRRGLHVLIEKPLAASVEEAEELAAFARARGLVLQVGQIERFSPAFEALSGMVATPLFIESSRIAPFSGRSTDTDVVLDLMIHDIDLLLALVNAPLESVDAIGAPVLTQREDIANARLRFANGCVANVTASRIAQKTERKLRLFQPASYIVADLAQLKLSRIVKTAVGFEADERTLERGDPLAAEIADFLRVVAQGGAPRVSGEEGARAVAAALAIGTSLRAHRERVAALLNLRDGAAA